MCQCLKNIVGSIFNFCLLREEKIIELITSGLDVLSSLCAIIFYLAQFYLNALEYQKEFKKVPVGKRSIIVSSTDYNESNCMLFDHGDTYADYLNRYSFKFLAFISYIFITVYSTKTYNQILNLIREKRWRIKSTIDKASLYGKAHQMCFFVSFAVFTIPIHSISFSGGCVTGFPTLINSNPFFWQISSMVFYPSAFLGLIICQCCNWAPIKSFFYLCFLLVMCEKKYLSDDSCYPLVTFFFLGQLTYNVLSLVSMNPIIIATTIINQLIALISVHNNYFLLKDNKFVPIQRQIEEANQNKGSAQVSQNTEQQSFNQPQIVIP